MNEEALLGYCTLVHYGPPLPAAADLCQSRCSVHRSLLISLYILFSSRYVIIGTRVAQDIWPRRSRMDAFLMSSHARNELTGPIAM